MFEKVLRYLSSNLQHVSIIIFCKDLQVPLSLKARAKHVNFKSSHATVFNPILFQVFIFKFQTEHGPAWERPKIKLVKK